MSATFSGLENNKIFTLTNTPKFNYNRGTSKKETPSKIGIKDFSLTTDYQESLLSKNLIVVGH